MLKFANGINSKNAKGHNKKKTFFYKFSPGNLIITLYQLTKFEAPSCKGLRDITFSLTIFAKGDNSNFFFFNFSPGYLLIISYKLGKFVAPSCYSF